jgi:hypothetical protein
VEKGAGLYEQVGFLDFASDYYPNKCMFANDVVYMTAKEKGLVAIDVSNPSSPTELDIYDTDEVAWDVFVDGNTAYVGDQTGGVVILDVSNPSSITKTDEIRPGLDCRGVYVTGDYLYLTGSTGSDGVFMVYDLANTSEPVFADTFTGDAAAEVYLADNKAYVAGGKSTGMLWVYDISSPTSVSKLGEFESDRGTGDAGGLNVYVVGIKAYLCNWGAGLEILDVSDPANITRLGYYETDNSVYEVRVDGNTAFIADGWGCLFVLDMTDPMNCEQVGAYDPDYASFLGLDVAGNFAYCPDNGNTAFHIVRIKK